MRLGRASTAALFAAVLAMLTALGGRLHAQDSTATATAPTVYLMTMGPGQLVWERFGHNALWIHDPVRGTDLTYDYGRFDFEQENFILRFVQGRMWYWMDGAPVDRYLRYYRQENRSIWIQELNLSPEARLELQTFLEWNVHPDHRYYRYDYYRDNCSTRLRDAIDRVSGGQLRAQTEGVTVPATYRFHTQRLTSNDIPIYTGLYAAIGPDADRPLSEWEEMFLPLAMREHVRHVTVRDAAGRAQPLVKSERTVYESTAPQPPASPPSWTLWYLAAGVVVGAGVALAGVRAERSCGARRVVIVWGVAWGLVAGVAGLAIAGLWFATDHAMTYRNLNFFHLHPLLLLFVVLLPAAARGARWARQGAWILAVGAVGLSIIGVLLQLLPTVGQVNAPIVALVLPIHLGVAVAARRIAVGTVR